MTPTATLEGLLEDALAKLERIEKGLTAVAGLAIRQALREFNQSQMSIASVDQLRAVLIDIAQHLDGGGLARKPYDDATAQHSVKVVGLHSVKVDPPGEPHTETIA